MKCLWYYEWVKLPRNVLPEGKGILGFYARLASRAAFRKGITLYCGHRNIVIPGMWSGGIVGIKSILGVKSRQQAFDILEELQRLGYIRYTLDVETKKLSYQILDWVRKCSGAPCMKGTAYTTEGYGFLCMPRNITERLAEKNYIFEEADAWLDLWCHTVTEDPNNAFSFLAPAVQYGKYGALLTLETLGQRWGWEKTKVWRFFKKHEDVFCLYRLPSSYGCLILNKRYPAGLGCTMGRFCLETGGRAILGNDPENALKSADTPDGIEVSLLEKEVILELLEKIRAYSACVPKKGSEHEHMSRMVAWYSRRLTGGMSEGESLPVKKSGQGEKNGTYGTSSCCTGQCVCETGGRIAFSVPIIYAYLSLCRNCKNCRYDCRRVNYYIPPVDARKRVRGPCGKKAVDLTMIGKELIFHE